ncbi:MFS transporter, partial [Janibacter sp. RAF20_2_2]
MSTRETFGWRRIAVPAFGPTFLSAAATGAVIPVAALRADELGASLGTAAFVVALTGVGQLVGVLPAGALVARIGERATLVRAGLLDVAALAVAGWAPSLWLMGGARLGSGLAAAAVWLARRGVLSDG